MAGLKNCRPRRNPQRWCSLADGAAAAGGRDLSGGAPGATRLRCVERLSVAADCGAVSGACAAHAFKAAVPGDGNFGGCTPGAGLLSHIERLTVVVSAHSGAVPRPGAAHSGKVAANGERQTRWVVPRCLPTLPLRWLVIGGLTDSGAVPSARAAARLARCCKHRERHGSRCPPRAIELGHVERAERPWAWAIAHSDAVTGARATHGGQGACTRKQGGCAPTCHPIPSRKAAARSGSQGAGHPRRPQYSHLAQCSSRRRGSRHRLGLRGSRLAGRSHPYQSLNCRS